MNINFGASDKSRTCYAWLFRPTLYRLSYRSMVPRQGLEPWAPALIVRCSTTELTGQRKDSGGNRTHDQSFADSCLNRLTTESWSGWLDLHQRSPEAADLQSAAIAAMRHPDIMHRPYWPGAIFNAWWSGHPMLYAEYSPGQQDCQQTGLTSPVSTRIQPGEMKIRKHPANPELSDGSAYEAHQFALLWLPNQWREAILSLLSNRKIPGWHTTNRGLEWSLEKKRTTPHLPQVCMLACQISLHKSCESKNSNICTCILRVDALQYLLSLFYE